MLHASMAQLLCDVISALLALADRCMTKRASLIYVHPGIYPLLSNFLRRIFVLFVLIAIYLIWFRVASQPTQLFEHKSAEYWHITFSTSLGNKLLLTPLMACKFAIWFMVHSSRSKAFLGMKFFLFLPMLAKGWFNSILIFKIC